MLKKFISILTLFVVGLPFSSAQDTPNYLANNTILIVRHAEKPLEGTGLTPMGEARAELYAKYFEPYHEDGLSFRVDSLYAGADSKKSMRPRLTLEPLSKVTGMPLHASVSTKNSKAMVLALQAEPHSKHPLIAWRHSEIPDLLAAFGASPEKILPNGKWPDDVFDWVIVLTIDSKGQVASAKKIQEHLVVQVPNP